MTNKTDNGLSDVGNQQPKINELIAVYEYLQNNVATATMTATALNIYRPSLCRRKRSLEKAGLLVEVKNAYCKVTKCKAAYLTTNPEWFPQQTQLKFNF
jgi:hypothetical protein